MILIVKSPFALLTSLATLMALSACGQTGPLYMPKPPARTPAANTNAAPAGPTNTAAPAVQISPPAPAAGVTVPAAGSNANNTEANNQTPPATQQ
ncbi:lipoprotein-attachment site-containing protein [Massilia sp. PDC64]|nr:lipoprotein-attachment site-containing protein [Massilia sp. PDC64]